MLAITGGTVYPVTGSIMRDATVIVNNGIIIDLGIGLDIPAGCEVVDASGRLVLPGFIDAHSHVGIFEEIYRIEGSDGNETTDPITPHLRAIDAINPHDVAFKDALSGGVTTVVITPGSANIIGGEMVAVKTAGDVIDHMVIKQVGVKAALGENPKRVYGGEKKTPATRMASAALLRQTLVETINYINKENKERNLKLESLIPVIERALPLRVHAHRADDIATAVRIAREFDINIIIEHCTEGYKVAKILADKNIPAVIGPIITNRAKVELEGINIQNAALLHKAGVKFAIMTDHPVVPIEHLWLSAALTVRGGLSEEEAIKAVTIYPAQILGLDQQLGSLEPGKDADIIMVKGDLFDIRCQVEKVFVNGIKKYDLLAGKTLP